MSRLFIALCLVFYAGASAHADDAADAQAMFAAGVAALEQHDADAARVAFERSLELHPTSAAAFNLAGVLTDLGRPSEACSLYEELGRGVYGALTEGQASEVERLANAAEGASAHIEVRVVAAGNVRITIGELQGSASESAPFTQRVNPGTHLVRGELEGAPPVEHEVEVAAGGRGRTLLRFQRSIVLPVADPVVTGPTTEDEQVREDDAVAERSGRPWLWVTLGILAAGGIATAVVFATRDSSDTEAGTVLPATGTLLAF